MPFTRRRALAGGAVMVGATAGCTAIRERVGDRRRATPTRRVAPDWRPGPGTWAERAYGPTNRRYNPHATPPRSQPTVAWRYEFDASLGDGHPVIVNGTVYAATERRLLALDAADGAVQWTRDIGGPAGLKYVDGRLYQVDYDLQEPDLVARGPDGDVSWRTTLPDKIRGVHERDGYVFVAGRDRYWTLHADTGEVVRERDTRVRNMASTRDSVYAAFSDHLVRYTVEGRTLEERWRVQDDILTEVVHPVVTDEWIYVPRFKPGGDEGELAVYGHDGEHRGRLDLNQSPRGLTVPSHDLVVVSTARVPGVHAMQRDGTRRWTVDVDGSARAIAADGTVYAGNPLVAIDAESGDRLWQRRAVLTDTDTDPGSTHVADLAATDSTLFAASDDAIAALRG